MNVDQLIKRLQMFPPDLRVVVSGYEGGYDDVDHLEKIKLALNVNDEWYYGKHEDATTIFGKDVEKRKANAVDALRIG